METSWLWYFVVFWSFCISGVLVFHSTGYPNQIYVVVVRYCRDTGLHIRSQSLGCELHYYLQVWECPMTLQIPAWGTWQRHKTTASVAYKNVISRLMLRASGNFVLVPQLLSSRTAKAAEAVGKEECA